MKKRGQITIFIIIGIVLLLFLGLFIYLRQATTIFKPERVIPPELEPLDEYIGGCINIVAREGLNLIGANGGFIRIPAEIRADPFASVGTNPFFDDIRNPMWQYRGSTRIPSEDFIKAELANYVNENIDSCLNNLSSFRAQFNIIELEPRNIIIELTDRGVDVVLNYKLEITSKAQGQSTILNNFVTSVPVRLKLVYELAKDLMEEQIKDKFVETRVIDLIAMDPDIPYTDLKFSCSPEIWYLEDVEDKLKRLLTVNLPLIRIDKTDYNEIPEDQPYVKNHYIWQVTEQKYPTTKAKLRYDMDWPLNLHVSPNEGFYLKSNPHQGFDMMSFFCMNLWHFTYDLRFPVIATITDEQGKNHEKYTFNFAFEAGIDKNRPDNSNFGSIDFDFEEKASSDEFCINSPKNLLTVHTFENVSTDSYGDLHEELSEVNLSYNCIRMECPMGQTDWEFRGAVSLRTAEVPYCVNGVLKGTKEGYEDAKIFVSTDSEKSVDLYLKPIVEKDIEIVKHSTFGSRINTAEPLAEDQSAIITLKRNNDFKEIAMYPAEDGDILSQLKLLGKWDYTYNLEVYIVDDRTILGGYKANWTIPWSKLKGVEKIRFHVAEFPYSEDADVQFKNIIALDSLSEKLPEPEFIG